MLNGLYFGALLIYELPNKKKRTCICVNNEIINEQIEVLFKGSHMTTYVNINNLSWG